MNTTDAEPDAPRSPIAWWTAGLVLLALVYVAVAVLVVDPDPSDNDGASWLTLMVGVPAVVTALIIQLMTHEAVVRKRRIGRAFLWWWLLVLPLGVLAGLGATIVRRQDYFVQEDSSPWELLVPLLGVVCGFLAGALLWFFFVFPIANLIGVIGRIARREVGPSMLIIPIAHLCLGIFVIILPLSIEPDATAARERRVAVFLALLGVPGRYEVAWEPGLWIARAIVVAIVLGIVIPWWRERRRTAADAAPD